jgi:GalNAc-alpha-(1->4)-GalNAc-alpha-(1->3)-diNAcBac-PP-undecaprenol alpha-1,4-N-acetyl-D-galactosaminyltransferase
MKKIVLILPSLTSGGMERVMTELAFYFANFESLDLSFICLTKGEKFYNLPNNISFYEPEFYYKNYNRFLFTMKTYRFLRKQLRSIGSGIVLSFSGRYNSFVLLASLGLKFNVYISERTSPLASYGKGLDLLNPIIYRMAKGIIAQTIYAKEKIYERTRHKNIKVIGNPIRRIENDEGLSKNIRENIILNVGRFIKSKNQELLIEYFAKINPDNWKLVFLGDGPCLNQAKKKAEELNISEKIFFMGAVKNIDDYYRKSKIFAFTSTLEGFPNALGEALSAGLACISFNCISGPSDLISNEINGFLVENNDHNDYLTKLKRLIKSHSLRSEFGKQALIHIKNFSHNKIGKEYKNFLLNNS